jgi:bifunctional non-homologous end joining protein LigD
MLAKVGEAPFNDKEWLFEIKWDGYRAIADLREKEPLFYSRNGISFLQKFPDVAKDFSLQKHKMILDGEIVVFDSEGKPNFQLLQQIDDYPQAEVVYQVFDLLWLNGFSTEELALTERKELLKEALIETDRIKFCDHILERGKALFEQMKANKLEGMIAKKADSLYRENYRSNDWLKIKITDTEEVIICGYTEPQGSRKYFGALILGRYKDNELLYCGHTGTGFNQKSLETVYELLQPLVITKSPFEQVPVPNAPVTWVKPEVVCEIKFSEITQKGIFRHPVFVVIREDKESGEIQIKTKTMKTKKTSAPSDKTTRIGKYNVNLTNQDKIYFPKNKITKGDLVDYYQAVADYILPHLKNRPLSLNRFPNGIGADNFYHKDAGDDTPSWVKTTEVYSESTDKDINYIVCNNRATLAYLNNLGCIDMNPWNSRYTKLDYPDYLVLDLDPSDKNTFDDVIEVAQQIKELLDEIKIEGYCKTSGSTGLHIYIPMGGKYHYDQVKDFAHILMSHTLDRLPEITTLERSLKKREKNQIYLDYLQNRSGQTLASVYSVRPREGATVSMPLEWSEVKKGLKPTDFTIFNALERIEKKGDLFLPVLQKGVNMIKAIERLEE